MKTSTDDGKYIAEYKVKSTAVTAESTSLIPDTIISIMEFDWEPSESRSDYIDKEKIRRSYNRFADLDEQLANVGIEEYGETLQKIDAQ